MDMYCLLICIISQNIMVWFFIIDLFAPCFWPGLHQSAYSRKNWVSSLLECWVPILPLIFLAPLQAQEPQESKKIQLFTNTTKITDRKSWDTSCIMISESRGPMQTSQGTDSDSIVVSGNQEVTRSPVQEPTWNPLVDKPQNQITINWYLIEGQTR